MTSLCPNCKSQKYQSLPEFSIHIQETLDRWEIETKTRFSKDTRDKYVLYSTSNFYKCTECHFGAFVPPCAGTSGFYNDITIDDDYYIDDKWEFIKTTSLIARKKPKSLLDFGCGGGSFVKKIAQNFRSIVVTGYDQNPQSKLSLDHTTITLISDESLIGENQYDMVTAFQILEHLENPFLALKKLHASLKDNGILVISVPNTLGPIRHFPFALTEIPPHHVNRFNAPSLKVFLANGGFEIEEISYEPLSRIFWDSYAPAIIENTFPKKLRGLFAKLKGRGVVLKMLSLLKKTSLKSLPVKGHSVYVVAKKCAG